MSVSNAPSRRSPSSRPGHRWRATVALGLTALLVAAACSGEDDASTAAAGGLAAEQGTLPAAAREIMEQPPYDTARWIYYVAEAESGEVLLANRADEMVFTASTAKQFVIGTAYDTLGPDTTITTPVYATEPVADGVVPGDVVLVASGDLALGGRNALEGRVDHTFTADTQDHVYGDVAPHPARVGDPLAGLDDLAGQVAAQGVTRIDGDVRIDTSLWETFEGQEGPVPPIFVNDNLLDLEATAAAEGEPATVEAIPENDHFTIEADVMTVAEDGETALEVSVSDTDPRTIVVGGTVAAGETQLTVHRIEDSAAWARALFIDALERAGVTVAAAGEDPVTDASLPASDSYPEGQELASLESAPLSAMGKMVLQTSYNTGANAFMCLLAVEAGSTDCTDGLETIYDLAEEAGVDTNRLFLVDGQGQDPASTTPREMTRWVQWAREQPWGETFVDGQPVLGESGSLAGNADSPAAGKVAAKTGTSVAVDMVTGRLYAKVQSLAGYMTLDDGTELVFGLSMSGATYPDFIEGLTAVGDDVALVAAAFQQSLSE